MVDTLPITLGKLGKILCIDNIYKTARNISAKKPFDARMFCAKGMDKTPNQVVVALSSCVRSFLKGRRQAQESCGLVAPGIP